MSQKQNKAFTNRTYAPLVKYMVIDLT